MMDKKKMNPFLNLNNQNQFLNLSSMKKRKKVMRNLKNYQLQTQQGTKNKRRKK